MSEAIWGKGEWMVWWGPAATSIKANSQPGWCRLLCVPLLPRHHAPTPQELEHLYGEIQTEKQAVSGSRLPAAFVTFK